MLSYSSIQLYTDQGSIMDSTYFSTMTVYPWALFWVGILVTAMSAALSWRAYRYAQQDRELSLAKKLSIVAAVLAVPAVLLVAPGVAETGTGFTTIALGCLPAIPCFVTFWAIDEAEQRIEDQKVFGTRTDNDS